MFTKKITYDDFAGERHTEAFQFNMTKAEVVEWQYSIKGGIHKKRLSRITTSLHLSAW